MALALFFFSPFFFLIHLVRACPKHLLPNRLVYLYFRFLPDRKKVNPALGSSCFAWCKSSIGSFFLSLFPCPFFSFPKKNRKKSGIGKRKGKIEEPIRFATGGRGLIFPWALLLIAATFILHQRSSSESKKCRKIRKTTSPTNRIFYFPPPGGRNNSRFT